MDWKFYARKLERIIDNIEIKEQTRILVDALVKHAKDEAECSSGWISVEDELPECGGDDDVLVFDKYEGRMFVAHLSKGDWYTTYGEFLQGVTHWMPLPQPPRKED